MDDELIRWCALATRAACSRMTAQNLKALQDSVGQARSLPARLCWDRKATAHAQIYNLLADVIADRPGPAMFLSRAGDADGAAAEMEQHLRRLHFMGRLACSSEASDVAV